MRANVPIADGDLVPITYCHHNLRKLLEGAVEFVHIF